MNSGSGTGFPLAKVQAWILAGGTVFSWLTLTLDYRRFFEAGGRVFELSGCVVPNPVTTPCFYGALAFFIAFVWSIAVLRSAPEAARRKESGLAWLLGAGTLFAWGNFANEAWRFYTAKPPSAFSCPPGEAVVNPFLAPCFYGALLFLAALVTSLLILRARNAEAR